MEVSLNWLVCINRVEKKTMKSEPVTMRKMNLWLWLHELPPCVYSHIFSLEKLMATSSQKLKCILHSLLTWSYYVQIVHYTPDWVLRETAKYWWNLQTNKDYWQAQYKRTFIEMLCSYGFHHECENVTNMLLKSSTCLLLAELRNRFAKLHVSNRINKWVADYIF